MKAIGYVRVSTEEQATEGVSLEVQKAKITAWCCLNDFQLISIYEDAGISGYRSKNRPGLQAALKAACSQGVALVVFSLSRLARSTRDTIEITDLLNSANADLVSLSEKIDTTSAAGKMVFRMLAVLNEFERDQISERTKNALAHLRKQNRRISRRIPFGYSLADDQKTLIENSRQQVAIKLMIELRSEGLSLRKIGEMLVNKGFETQYGGKWTPATIKQIIDRERLIYD